MFTIRILNATDKREFDLLVAEIEKNVVCESWWLPIKETAREHFFNPDWTTFVGCFDGDKLVGASALFWNEFEYHESLTAIGGAEPPIAEIGRCMVLPDYRGKNLMFEMNKELLKLAKERKVKHLIATAHPDNKPSNRSLEKLGFSVIKCIIKDNLYPRNVLLMKLF